MLSRVFTFVCMATVSAIHKPTPFPEMDCAHVHDPIVPLGLSLSLEDGATVHDYSNDPRDIFLWTGGGSGGMGNAFVGYLTSFYDAMRCGRRLVMPSTPEFTFSDLGLAFELGVPVADPKIEFEGADGNGNFVQRAGVRVRKLHPGFFPEDDSDFKQDGAANVTFKLHHKQVSADDYSAVQSRMRNIHFDRTHSLALLQCHFRAVGCGSEANAVPSEMSPTPLLGPKAVHYNVLKTSCEDPQEYCGESRALRRLVLGVNQRLLSVAHMYAATWMGPESPPHRLHRLLAARSSDPVAAPHSDSDRSACTAELSTFDHDHFNHWNNNSRSSSSIGSSTLVNRSAHCGGPVWDVAVHVRVGFNFVEQGGNEVSHAHEIEVWLQKPDTQKALAEVVVQVQKHFKSYKELHQEGVRGIRSTDAGARAQPFAVYVASETSTVRAAVAALVLEGCPGAEVDYFNFSGTPHPVATGGNHGRKHAVSERQPQAAVPNSGRSGAIEDEPVISEQKKQADLLFPFLEWWALAHSRFIVVRRGENLRAAGSTYSGTAHLYGGWAPH